MEVEALREHMQVASEAARRAGTVLEQWRQRFAVREKGRFDLVTDADLAAQDAIEAFLHERFPDHGFVGEEGGAKAPPDLHASNRLTWIVDPLDGTTTYVHDCPLYAVSIALALGTSLETIRSGLKWMSPRLNSLWKRPFLP
jgi:myo-inositol-1(or 4)-monophosphatase